LTGITLIIIAFGEKDSMLITLLSASIPFISTSYWNFYTYRFEKITGSDSNYFTYGNYLRGGVGISYNNTTVVPFFLVMFISTSLAIVTFFLAVNLSTEDYAVGTLGLSFLLSTVITVYFSLRIKNALQRVLAQNNSASQSESINNEDETRKINDEIAVKIAFIFASIATLGLFSLVYYIIKKARSVN
jgi:hypothetical protein